MDATSEKTSVERELAIAASPETVWTFLTDPAKVTTWMGLSATYDLRRGGEWRSEVVPDNIASGEFVEIDAPRRLVYTWGWEPRGGEQNPVPSGSSTIEFELVADGDGTLLHFVHRDLPSEEATASHAHGWDHYFERLVVAAAGGDAGRDPWLDGPM